MIGAEGDLETFRGGLPSLGVEGRVVDEYVQLVSQFLDFNHGFTDGLLGAEVQDNQLYASIGKFLADLVSNGFELGLRAGCQNQEGG